MIGQLNEWIAGLAGYSTLIFYITAHKNVATITPCIAPRILDNIVVLPLRGSIAAIADGEHTMIEIRRRACWLVVDTLMVVGE